jgi:hypothetical protein
MVKKPSWTIKALTPKQIEQLKAGNKIGGGSIPPWVAAANKNTNLDLKRFTIYQVQDNLDAALETGKHREQLLELKALANRAEIAQNIIFNMPKRAPNKHRERVAELITDLELAISQLDNSTGFDLFDKGTW